MISIISGGSASGKSEYAEKLIEKLPGTRVYIATMQPWDDECLARIEKHRRQRAHRGFITIERYTDLGGIGLPTDANVLLEDLSNLLANETFSPEGGGEKAVIEGIKALAAKSLYLTIVTNDIFSSGDDYSEETISYMKSFARVNIAAAEMADFAAEIIYTIPNILKGDAPQ